MNKQAQMNLGILVVFIGVIVALVIYTAISTQVGVITTTIDPVNVTYTAPAAGATIDLNGQELIGTPVVTNETGGVIVVANYTIAEGISSTTSQKSILFTTDADSEIGGQTINVSVEYGGEGYIASSSGRSIALLIPIFAALAIVVFALSETARDKFMGLIGK